MRDNEMTKAQLIKEPDDLRRRVVELEKFETERKQAEEDIKNSARFPSENPNPVLRINQEGIVLFANEASKALLRDWPCEVGGQAPAFWRNLVVDAFKNHALRTVDVQLGEQLYTFDITAIPNTDYANLYGRDITERKKAYDKLKESEERFQALFNRSLDLVYLHNFEGNFLDANQPALSILGYDRKDILSLNFASLIDSDQRTKALQIVDEVKKNGSHQGFSEFKLKCKDGRYVDVETKSSVVYRNGKPYAILGIARDMTERKRAEEALRESEEKFRSILGNIEDGYYEVDLAGNLTFFNDAMTRINEYSRDEMMGVNYRAYTDAENAKKVYRDFNQVYSTGEPSKGTVYEMITKDGEKKTLETSVSLIKDSSGKPIGFRGIARDITELRQTQASLLESEDRYRDLVESSRDLMCTHDLTGKILWMNEQPLRILGYDKEFILKMNIRDFLAPGKNDEFDVYLATLKSQGVASGVLITFTAKGEKRFWEYHNTLRTEGMTEPIVRGMAHDVTERLLAEKETKETLEKLRKAMGGIIQAMTLTVERRDPYTAGHQRRVSNLGRAIAQEMALSKDQIEAVRVAGLVHDLGKIAIPAEILSKPTELSDIEFSLIKIHSQTSYDILKDIDFPWPVARITLQHHERMDGSGYPAGLKGGEILQEAKVLMVADVIESIASHRPYRPARGIDVALEEISQNKGVLYDHEVVNACLKLFREKKFKLE